MTTPATKLAHYFREAAHQRRLMQSWLKDKEFVASGGQILYAVDTDVVILYTAPEKMSVSKGPRGGYAQIFHDDEPNVSTAIGRALAEYIFNHLSGSLPILVIPPIEEEIQEIFNLVIDKSEKEQQQAYEDLDKIRKIVSSNKDVTDEEQLYKALTKEASTLTRFIAGRRGPTAELIRFNRLLANSRIAPPDFILNQNMISDEAIRQALAPVEGILGWMKMHELSEAWLSRLQETKSAAKNAEKIERDARMIARLEWINRVLHEHDINCRMFYITGDQSLFKAAQDYTMKEDSATFADSYLRHPRAYLAEENVLLPVSDTGCTERTVGNKFIEWLEVFIGKSAVNIDDMLRKNDSELHKLAEEVLKTHPDISEQFRKDWNSYTSNLMLSYGLSNSVEEEENKTIKKLLQDIQRLIYRVEEKLEEKRREAWNGCYKAAAEVGLIVSRQKDDGYIARNIPPLLFNSLEITQQFVHHIVASYKKGSLDDYRDSLKKLECSDNSGYSNSLIYALLFGAEGNWHIAAILAAHAMDIAEQCKPLNITGREAAYLRSIALRNTSRRVEDLSVSISLLKHAEKCLEKDRLTRPNLHEHDIRFEAEYIAIYLCYHMYRLFLDQKIPSNVPDLAQLQERAEKMLGTKVDDLLMKLDSRENDLWIARNVERHLLAIVFMAALLRSGKEKALIKHEDLYPYLERFHKNIEAKEGPGIQVPYQIQAIYLTAAVWLSDNPNEKKQLSKKLKDHLSSHNIERYSVFPYDKERFMYLRKFALSL